VHEGELPGQHTVELLTVLKKKSDDEVLLVELAA
jgi:hypothetical protein